MLQLLTIAFTSRSLPNSATPWLAFPGRLCSLMSKNSPDSTSSKGRSSISKRELFWHSDLYVTKLLLCDTFTLTNTARSGHQLTHIRRPLYLSSLTPHFLNPLSIGVIVQLHLLLRGTHTSSPCRNGYRPVLFITDWSWQHAINEHRHRNE